ncbi:PAS domain S-box-containing protein [Natronincola peptidivorans]|uniref:PAS domain S-box-containing protein n=1 Tax=Natronincola peptidivorans TaxID=426128 RepID=A0A1I0BMX4_9FIRM|nr:sigma 54-interacting transcriptional regulator [Natronincola peptidivorans]SET07971.1 PAS domain S-box-containing protein [Natronincola peptidivorans]
MIDKEKVQPLKFKEEITNNCIMSKEIFDEVVVDNFVLIENAKIFMNYLLSFMGERNFVIILTDKKGTVLEIVGGEYILQKSKEDLNFVKGAMLKESLDGRSAINLAIKQKSPAQVCGDEHQKPSHKSWSCYAAPIMIEEEIKGAICLSTYTKEFNTKALGMVIASAKGIENQIKNHIKTLKIQEQTKYQNAIVENITEGFLTIDKNGILTYINDKGSRILGINKEESIGKHVGELVPFKPIILEVLDTGKGYTDREYVLENFKGGRYHLLKTAIPIWDEDGELIGVIDIFKEIKYVKKMVNSMVGAKANFTFDDIAGKSSKLRQSIKTAKKAAQSSSNTLILGESGTGKELFAQAIHNRSARRNGPFIAINCAAMPKELIEIELFGYASGAFTGGIKGGRPGKFELANGGTIFLDEIGDMPISVQAKLLRVLQDRKIVRVGGDNLFSVDVRIIAATNKNLYEACKNDEFRWDIYYRLNVLTIHIPPLRERPEDIKEITLHLIRKVNKRIGKAIKGINEGALKALEGNCWKGNVRELENVLERSMNICDEEHITIEDLPEAIKQKHSQEVEHEGFQEKIKLMSLEEMEKELITETLMYCKGNVSKASKILNVSRNTLYNKMGKYQLSI